MKETEEKRMTIDPFIDWSFKFIFGREETKDIMMGFLNVLLNPEIPIQDITYLNNERIDESAEGRECIVDVLCTDLSGDRFLVEMQYAEISYLRNRILYYTCRLIDEMGRKGEDWKFNLNRVYSICMMNFNERQNPSLRSDALLMDIKTGQPFSDRLHIVTLQIPRLKAGSLKECRENYEKLLSLLKLLKDNKMTIEEVCAQIDASDASPELKATMHRIAETANYANLSEEEREKYEASLKRHRVYLSSLDCAEQKGREEEALKIARNMKDLGLPAETIVKATGLSEGQVAGLG